MTLRDLNDVISKEVNMDKRTSAKSQYKDLNAQFVALKQEYDTLRLAKSETEKQKQRQDLLTFRNPNERQPSLVTEESAMAHERSALEYGQQKVEDFISAGQQALQNLQLQKSIFKGTQRRALDLAQRLGVSDNIIRIIQGRNASDRYIFWGCIFGVLLLLLWIILGRYH